MKDLMGLIYTGENDQFLRELTSAAHAQNLVVSVDTPVPQAYTMYYQRGEQARFVDYMIVSSIFRCPAWSIPARRTSA